MPESAESSTNHTGETLSSILPSSTSAKMTAVRLSTTDFFSSLSTAFRISTHTHT